MIETITILKGQGRDGQPEPFERIDLHMGQVVSIVGPTGSGKTTFINDIELFADGNTPSGRHVLINGTPAPVEFRYNPAKNPIALITQHTTFLSDLPVREFLDTHCRVRGGDNEAGHLVAEAIEFANQLTGEPIDLDNRMTELSGGQTRALLIADATVICSTPVVLLDEVENAGIHRTRAVQLLRQHRKIFIFVTHDPRIALLSDFRIVMQARLDRGRAIDQRRRAERVGPRQPARRRAFRLARQAPARTAAHRRRTAGGRMRVAICAGPATTGKTSVLRHMTRKLLQAGHRVAFLKLDVQYADEDELLAQEFGIPTKKVYSGELCPDHCHVMVLGDALEWADSQPERHPAGRDRRAVPALFALRRRRPGARGARSHQRHEPAAEGRAHALAGRPGRGHEDRPGVAGRTGGVPGADSGRRPARPHPRGQRPARHRHRSLGGRGPRRPRGPREAFAAR